MTFIFSSDGRRFLGLALAIGLIVRLVLFWHTDSLGTPIADEQAYVKLATSLVNGDGFALSPGHPTSVRPPLYAFFVAAVFKIAGVDNFQAVRIAQTLLGLVTVALVYLIGRQVFSAVVGRYAAGVFWLYPSLIFFNLTLLTETLFTLLLLAFVLAFVKLVREPSKSTALVCGLCLGLAALTRSVVWPLPLVLCPLLLVLMVGSFKDRLAWSALVLTGYALAVTPWAVRSTRLQGTLTIIDSMDFQHFRYGNEATTRDDRMWSGGQPPPTQKHEGTDDVEDVQAAAGGEESHGNPHGASGVHITEGAKDHQALRQALAYVIRHPGTTLRRSFIKFADFWGIEREFVAGVEWGFFSPPVWFVILASLVIGIGYVLVALFGAAGIWLAAPERRLHIALLLPVIAITGAHTLAFAHSRYHFPLIPILILYGAALATRSEITWRRYQPALIGATLAVTVLIGIWARQIILVDAERLRGFLHHVI